MDDTKNIKIAFIGGGSENWSPNIVRDIIFKEGLQEYDLDIRLIDIDPGRLDSIQKLFDSRLKYWNASWAKITSTTDAAAGLAGVDFVIIAISTGRLPAMRWDLEIPERYGIYHTVGDTAGPGGWSRALRNIPVFQDYARLIKDVAPNAVVLNYTNPMGVLTKVLADELGANRVVGLCHGLFECYDVLQAIFDVKEEDIRVRFGGINHFFWILDLKINGRDGYDMLRGRLNGHTFAELIKETHVDAMGWSSDKWLSGELFENYGYLPYVGDRHTCEFFNCYMTDLKMQERFKLVRTTIEDREKIYEEAGKRIKLWTAGETTDWGHLDPVPSRETAADIIKAIVCDQPFSDVVNLINVGQISNLPMGAVVETMGMVDSTGFSPLSLGALPDSILSVVLPHANVQIRTTDAGLRGDLEAALMALVADPICSHLTISDAKKMGMELLEANRSYVPELF